ncbi:clarin-3 isoform X2 [Rhinatrema bivittatum]|uniref:clarin-3 isoform X2 n=1 Tax=Rhinatrema bivittatum TaxID=194408 RepID=UPI001125EA68|nr:clarin-3 isoform X2 [Rhinatrema bivittatum]
MPSQQKILMFLFAFFASIGSFSIICVVLGTQNWVYSEIFYNDTNSNGIITISYGLFEGVSEKIVLGGAGLDKPPETFQVLQNLKGTGSPEVVNIFIILLLVLCLLCSVMSLGITCYNSVSNPYQDFFGPIAVYTWNAINVNTEANQQPTKLFKGIPSGLQQLATYNSYGYSFWLLLLIIILNAATIMIVYFYQHARYSKKKEQQRPMETAPKDVILF